MSDSKLVALLIFVFALIGFIGIVLPYLISAKSDVLVGLGCFGVVGFVVGGVLVMNQIVKQLRGRK